MSDLMKTPSNRRYVINFQQKEPSNLYDIWLSFNKHKEGNNVVVDSSHLADKDLVFKIYTDGKWTPILGIPVSYEGIVQALEDLDKKKMNIISPSDWEEGHIPVFQQGDDECDQLVDGGSLFQMLQAIINNGGYIPLQRATTSILGGIKAAIHSPTLAEEQYVEAKFKNEEGSGENDRLYVSASEIAGALNELPDAGGLNIYEEGEGIDITDNTINNIQATDSTTGGVRVNNWKQSTVIKNLGAEVYYGNNNILDAVTREIIDDKHLCITHEQIWALVNYEDEYTEPMFRTGFGIQPHAHHDYNSHTDVYDDYYTFDLIYGDSDWGKVLKIKDDGSNIEWVPQLNYNAGYGITIDNTAINCNIEENTNSYEVTSSLLLQTSSNGISMVIDNPYSSEIILEPYTYIELSLGIQSSSVINITFDTENQPLYMNGNPVYIIMNVSELLPFNTQLIVNIPSSNNKARFININATTLLGGHQCLNPKYSRRFLCTLQFGIVKIEAMQ